jgi:hypothetical protein
MHEFHKFSKQNFARDIKIMIELPKVFTKEMVNDASAIRLAVVNILNDSSR